MKYDLGFLGGGQLARMSIQAAQRMGLRCVCLDPDAGACAGQISDLIVGALDDPSAISKIRGCSSRITLENEFTPASLLANCGDELMPGAGTLGVIQDKLRQREAYAKAGVPSPRACALPIEGESGFPLVLKARFGGYDGKGTRYARTQEEFDSHKPLWEPVHGSPWLAEEFVPFRRELAVMVYRSPRVTGAYPTMETVQTNHVCDLVFSADIDASAIAIAAVEAVGGYGLFGVELFEREDGAILVNEIAPRPHNSGHYTLDWGGIGQFEMHVRLAMDFPVPPTVEGLPVVMANLLAPAGREDTFDLSQAITRALEVPGTHVHWYGKLLRPGRKVGHINAGGADAKTAAIEARIRFWGHGT